MIRQWYIVFMLKEEIMTSHTILCADARQPSGIRSGSVNLVVTSPPYPMIKMWDEIFTTMDPAIGQALADGAAAAAFRLMHAQLEAVWRECDRVLAPGGFICINVGDATRTIEDDFQLFSNHSAIISFFMQLGYHVLPDIIWRKPTNAPNKFMGSGMYPAGAYVTYEHEYILIFRKGGKRKFSEDEKILRRQSAYFWEERNVWFSDLWQIRGASQVLKKGRERSAAFPLEIPYRLINMYSLQGDLVLDPFSGLATTTQAALAAQRNSIAIDIDPSLQLQARQLISSGWIALNQLPLARLKNHQDFLAGLDPEKLAACYENTAHRFLVRTRQEKDLVIRQIKNVSEQLDGFYCSYSPVN